MSQVYSCPCTLLNGTFTSQLTHFQKLAHSFVQVTTYLTHMCRSDRLKDMKKPKTLQQAIVYFSDAQRAFDYAVSLRWPNGKVTCPRCDSEKHSFIKTRRIWFCYGCKKQFTVKVGTVFEDSALGLDKWMTAVWMLINCKNGISSYELARALGVTQKSAWFMLHRIRLVLQGRSTVKLGGSGKEVEVDETFIGGAARFMTPKRRARTVTNRRLYGKTLVVGLLERNGHVRTAVTGTRRKRDLETAIAENVETGSHVYTDKLPSYDDLVERGYRHKVVDHAIQYVNGRVHTNGLENFWSLLKRGLKGTYVAVEPFHLFRYLDEQAWRYNNRGTKERPINDGQRFERVMPHVFGRRLTYAELTGKGTDSLHEGTAGAW